MNQSIKSISCSVIVVCISCITINMVFGQDGATGNRDDDFTLFLTKLHGGKSRFILRPEARTADEARVEPERLEKAIKNSTAWIRALINREFVSDDLESHVEGVVGCYLDSYTTVEPPVQMPYDCTRATFKSKGYAFLITQDSRSIDVLVALPEGSAGTDRPDADALATELQSQAKKLFKHASVSLYLRAIRVTDFGVELVDPFEVWYSIDERWKSTVVVPSSSWEDGILPYLGRRPTRQDAGVRISDDERSHIRNVAAAKLREIDSTLPKDQASGFDVYWWGFVYAATDGHVLTYSAVKKSDGQSVLPAAVPDWFRVLDPDELPDIVGQKGDAVIHRARDAIDPPQ